MKSHTNLYESICTFENLLHASSKAQRGKRFKASTARFNFFLERELLTLQDELLTQRYRPGSYTTFTIREPKTRLISAPRRIATASCTTPCATLSSPSSSAPSSTTPMPVGKGKARTLP